MGAKRQVVKPAMKGKATPNVLKKPAGAITGKVVPKVMKKPSRFSSGQQRRHQDIVVHIKAELVEWARAAEDSGAPSRGAAECPLCGRVVDRRWNMQRHVESHTTGKLSSLVHAMESNHAQQPHPVYMQVIRALHDNDVLLANEQGNYASRARALLSGWLRFRTSAKGCDSLFTVMGARDCNMVLVLTESGPEFWARADPALQVCQTWGAGHHYTMVFANAYLRHLLHHGGITTPALRAMRLAWQGGGSEVTHLTHRNSEHLAELACQLMESAAMGKLRQARADSLTKKQEYRSLSMDATYKLAMKVVGQARAHSFCWTTIVGLRGLIYIYMYSNILRHICMCVCMLVYNLIR